MRYWVSVGTVLFLIAGCLDAQIQAPTLTEGGGLISRIAYACPPGGEPRQQGVCTSEIRGPEAMSEPYLVIHPKDDTTLVVGVNEGQPIEQGVTTSGTVTRQTVALRVSEDGGATWRRSAVPIVPIPCGEFKDAYGGDPALAFDAQGTLHVTWLVNPSPYEGCTFRVLYASTRDLGRSWSEPIILSTEGRNDRQWMTVGPDGTVYVLWRDFTAGAETAHVAWSVDTGHTWSFDTTMGGCVVPSPPVANASAIIFACATKEGGSRPVDVALWRFEPSSRSLERLGALPVQGFLPHLSQHADGSLVAAVHGTEEDARSARLMRTSDLGTSWTVSPDLLSLTSIMAGTMFPEIKWIAGDPWGGVHVLLGGLDDCLVVPQDIPNFGGAYFCSGIRQGHAAFDPRSWRVTVDAVLAGVQTAPEVPQAVVPESIFMRDDYHGLQFTPTHGVAVWSEFGRLGFTSLERADT